MAPDMMSINWIAVGIAVVANFILGFLWYAKFTPTGRIWMRGQGLDPEKMGQPKPGELVRGLVIQVVGAVLIMASLAYMFIAMNPQYNGSLTWMAGLYGGFFVWLGFFLPMTMAPLAWERRPLGFVLVNAGYWLVSLCVAGAIIGAMP